METVLDPMGIRISGRALAWQYCSLGTDKRDVLRDVTTWVRFTPLDEFIDEVCLRIKFQGEDDLIELPKSLLITMRLSMSRVF